MTRSPVELSWTAKNMLYTRQHWTGGQCFSFIFLTLTQSPKPKWTIAIIICTSLCHHDIQYFPWTSLPHSFIIQNTISESDSKSLRQGGGANMNNILLPVDINANLLFLQRISWHHRKTRQSKHCRFCIYIFDDSFAQSKSMITFVR